MNRAYAASSRVLSVVLMALGLAMAISAITRGGGPLALGVVVGVMFVLLGAGRLWLSRSEAAG